MKHTRDSPTTPAILIDRQRLESNLAKLADLARREGVALRPHVKTHRSCFVAERQVAHGATGLTCSKPAEAAPFLHAGFTDLRIAYSIADPAQWRDLGALAQRGRVSGCVESLRGVEIAEAALHGQGFGPLDVLVELDTGYGRAGVGWQSTELGLVAAAVQRSPALRLVGVLTHAGNSYGLGRVEAVSDDSMETGPGGSSPCQMPSPGRDRLLEVADQERDRTLQAAAAIRPLFEVDEPELSIGSTPTMARFTNANLNGLRITEIRPGNYVFYDLTQVAIGSARLDQCAATVLLTVVTSRSRDDAHHVLLDGGKKVLTADTCTRPGYGTLLAESPACPGGPRTEWSGAVVHTLSEEHAWVRIPRDQPRPEVGERVRVVPNHACVVFSTANRVYLEQDGEILHEVAIEARQA